MRKAIAQIGRRSRFARLGAAVGGSAMGRAGSGTLLPPAVYSSLKAPGGYGRTAGGVGAHTHSHAALLNLLVDNHSQYLLGPRAKLRIVAPAGAPYTSPKTAIEACAAGDMVLILGGAYDIAATITFSADNITVMGANRDGVVLNFTAADATDCINLNTCDGITLRDFTVQAVAGKTGQGIYGAGSADCLLYNVDVAGADLTYCLCMTGSSDRLHVVGCTFSGTSPYVVNIYGSDDVQIESSRIEDAGSTYGILLRASHRLRFTNNHIYGSHATPSFVVYVYDCSDIQLHDTIVSSLNARSNGIWVRAVGANQENCSIQNNVILNGNAAGSGVLLSQVAAWTLLDCIAANNLVAAYANGVKVAGANVQETLVHGNHLRTCTASVADTGTNTSNWDNT